MSRPFDAEAASVEISDYIREVMQPPSNGARLGSILGAYIFKAVLRDRGFAVVPIASSPKMRSAFKRGWLKRFPARYAAMVEAAWPDNTPATIDPQAQKMDEQEFIDHTKRILDVAVAGGRVEVTDAIIATTKALGVMIQVAARRDGVDYDTLLKYTLDAVALYAAPQVQ